MLSIQQNREIWEYRPEYFWFKHLSVVLKKWNVKSEYSNYKEFCYDKLIKFSQESSI